MLNGKKLQPPFEKRPNILKQKLTVKEQASAIRIPKGQSEYIEGLNRVSLDIFPSRYNFQTPINFKMPTTSKVPRFHPLNERRPTPINLDVSFF